MEIPHVISLKPLEIPHAISLKPLEIPYPQPPLSGFFSRIAQCKQHTLYNYLPGGQLSLAS